MGGALPHEVKEPALNGKTFWQALGYSTKAAYLAAREGDWTPLGPEARAGLCDADGQPIAEHNPDLPVGGAPQAMRYMPLADGSQALHIFRNGRWEQF